MQNTGTAADSLPLLGTPADVRKLLCEHGLSSFAYFDRQLECEAQRAFGAWPLLAREMSRRMENAAMPAQLPALKSGAGY